MAKSPNWASEELEVLKVNYPRLGRCKELQDLFPTRTLDGIALKANRLGLKVINNIRIGRTNDEYVELLERTNFSSLEEYKGSTVPILHKCKICSHEWNTRPQHTLKEGAQCPVCDLKTRTNSIEYINEILDKANLYAHTDYLGSFKDLTVEHLDCGYVWTTKFSYIQQGSGCPLCNRGFGYIYHNEQLPKVATLYLFKIAADTEVFYKVGITVRPIQVRKREIVCALKKVYTNVEVELISTNMGSGINILKKEQYILSSYTKYVSKEEFPGHRELLDISSNVEDKFREYNE